MPAHLFNFCTVLRKGALGMIASMVMLSGYGCGSKPAVTPQAPRPAAAKTGAKASEPEVKITASPLRSTFVVQASSKNPFFPASSRIADPGVRPAKEATGARTPESSGNALALALQAGFQGIVGVGADRVALINNSTLELERDTWLSLMLDGREQKVRVRATKISRGSITVLVNGQPQPIIVNVFKKK